MVDARLEGSRSEPNFQFIRYTARIEYEPLDLAGVKKAVSELDRSAFLTLGETASSYLLASPSSSTQAHASFQSLSVSTNFFDGFESPDSWPQRNDYFTGKLSALLNSFEAAGARLQFIGVTTIAQVAVDKSRIEDVRARVFEALAPPVLTGGTHPYDFAFRASRFHGDQAFFNTYVNWYQTRNFQVQAPIGSAPLQVSGWAGVLAEEGVDVKFDINNKRGLYSGRRDWSADVLLALASEGMSACEPAFEEMLTFLAPCWHS